MPRGKDFKYFLLRFTRMASSSELLHTERFAQGRGETVGAESLQARVCSRVGNPPNHVFVTSCLKNSKSTQTETQRGALDSPLACASTGRF